MINATLIDQCIKRFEQEPKIRAVWILGSAVTDRLREDSDVDLAIYYQPGSGMDFTEQGLLIMDLECILGRKVDLGQLSSLNLIYALQALQTGKLLFAHDPQEALEFTSRIQTLYLELKQDRKIVEDAYCA